MLPSVRIGLWRRLAIALLLCHGMLTHVQDTNAQGFASITPLTAVPSTKNTGEKPQSKVWKYNGKWWAVFPNSSGTFIWKLEGSTWMTALKISSNTTTKADCKVVGDVCHILLWKKADSPSQLVSVEYVSSTGNYKLWSQRPATAFVSLDPGTETGTIDIDGTGRMWLASDGFSDIRVRWSDPPYTTWSAPITLASGTKDDDICVVVALPVQNQIGVFWSNQNTKRFGFRTHDDGTSPSLWSDDESPASQSAIDVGYGFGDDHMNMDLTTDGTLYCASKTSYDTPGYPKLILLRRTPDGRWEDSYDVSQTGTRGMIVLNEQAGKLKYIYTEQEDGGNILYKESGLNNISFGPAMTLMHGVYNNPTSMKDSYDSDIVILASNTSQIVGVYATDYPPTQLPGIPQLVFPSDQSDVESLTPTFQWNAATAANSYQLQLSTDPNFTSLLADESNIQVTSLPSPTLQADTEYFWRVRALNGAGYSDWSDVSSFFTTLPLPAIPSPTIPANGAISVSTDPELAWLTSQYANAYEVELASDLDFANVILRTTTNDTTAAASSLTRNSVYYWRVRAFNSTGISEWSSVSSFTTIINPPSPPQLVYPLNDITDVETSVLFAWDTVPDATLYSLQVSTDSSFTNLVTNATGITTTSKLIVLSASTHYYWRVAANNAGGSSEWSGPGSFTTAIVSLTSLVGHWKLDEGAGITVVDHSGHVNNGSTIGAPVWVTGTDGLALKLNGSNQYATIPDAPSLDVTQAVTLSAWIKPEKIGSQHIISKGQSGITDGYELTLLSTGKVSFRFNQKSSSSYKINSRTLYTINDIWMHIAATYDGTTARLYINGTEDKAVSFTPTAIVANSQGLVIGAEIDESSFFRGTLDDVRIYNVALTAAEILALAGSPTQISTARTSSTARTTAPALTTVWKEDEPVEHKVEVFPNPASEKITIGRTDHAQESTLISISDLYGRSYYKQNATLPVAIELSRLSLRAGVYVIQIQCPKHTHQYRFVKQ